MVGVEKVVDSNSDSLSLSSSLDYFDKSMMVLSTTIFSVVLRG